MPAPLAREIEETGSPRLATSFALGIEVAAEDLDRADELRADVGRGVAAASSDLRDGEARVVAEEEEGPVGLGQIEDGLDDLLLERETGAELGFGVDGLDPGGSLGASGVRNVLDEPLRQPDDEVAVLEERFRSDGERVADHGNIVGGRNGLGEDWGPEGLEKDTFRGDRAVVSKRGLSSRAVILSLAVLAVGLVAALFGLMDGRAPSGPAPTVGSASSKTVDPRGSLEANSESSSARTDTSAPKVEESSTPKVAGSLIVSGTVLDTRTRVGVPDVEVEGYVEPGPDEKHSSGKTVTDSQGRYSLGIPWSGAPRAVKVRVSGERTKEVNRWIAAERFQPDPGTPETFVASEVFEVVEVLAIRGRLVSESDGKPIRAGWTSATLVLVEKAPALPRDAPVCGFDWDGETDRFLIQVERMIPGELAVIGAAKGYLARMKPASLDLTRTVDIGDIALPEGVCIEGVVSTADGSPTLATHVFAELESSNDTWIHLDDGSWAVRGDALIPFRSQSTIGPDGSFKLCSLIRDRYVLWVDYAGCRTPSGLDSLVAQAPASDVRIPITTALYRLSVHDARSNAKLDRARFHFDDFSDFDCGIVDESFIATDPAREYPGKIVAEGYHSLKCSLPVLAPSETRNLEFRLEPLPHLVAAMIVVTSPTGGPVQDIEVKIRAGAGDFDSQGPIPKMSHTAPDGRHELPKLPPGTYDLEIEPWRDGDPAVETWLGAVIEIQVREGMGPVEVRLEEGGLVQATVTKQDGTPVDARTSLVRTPESEPELIDWRNEAGTFAGWIPKQTIVRIAEPLPPGPWTLRFEAEGCESQDVVVQIVAGDTTTIAVALEPTPPR